jgi:hypothetical protein
MKLAPLTFAFLLATSGLGCAFMAPQGANDANGANDKPSNHVVIPKESKDIVRKSEQDAYAKGIEAEEEQLAKLEKDTIKALNVSLGKQAAWQGGQVGESAATSLRAIKAATGGAKGSRGHHIGRIAMRPLRRLGAGRCRSRLEHPPDLGLRRRPVFGRDRAARGLCRHGSVVGGRLILAAHLLG